MMKGALPMLILVVCAMGQFSCSTTGLGRSWAPPDAAPITYSKLAVVAMTKQEVYRIQAEDALVSEIGNASVASHTIVQEHRALRDTAAVVKALRQAGCDGVVTLRLTSGAVRPAATATPANTSASFNDHVDDYWIDPALQEPSQFAPGQYYSVEVNVFDLRSGEMVWNGLAIEQNATDAADLVRRVSKDVRSDLRKRGLISATR